MDDYAASVKAILDQENIPVCCLVGHSMGAYIGLAFAAAYPEYLTGLGLFHSTSYPDSAEKKNAREKSIAFIESYGSGPFIEQSIPGLFSEDFKKTHPEKIAAIVHQYANSNPVSLIAYYRAMIDRPDRTELMKSIQVPVLLVLGDQDKAVPFEDGLRQSYLPQICYIHILQRVGHMGMLEYPAETNLLLNRFLKDVY
jgi:pimeloyl-ACP methyl ester carboxylesterase